MFENDAQQRGRIAELKAQLEAATKRAEDAEQELLDKCHPELGTLTRQIFEATERAETANALTERLREALEAIDGQAVCAGMDGPEGDAKMLDYIHGVAEQALADMGKGDGG